MAWLVLVVSGVFESVWAIALGRTEGFTKPAPTVVFLVALVLSMAGLAYAMRELPTGTAYAVWTGIGTVGTLIFGILLFHENVSAPQILCVCLIVSGIVGLRLLAGQ